MNYLEWKVKLLLVSIKKLRSFIESSFEIDKLCGDRCSINEVITYSAYDLFVRKPFSSFRRLGSSTEATLFCMNRDITYPTTLKMYIARQLQQRARSSSWGTSRARRKFCRDSCSNISIINEKKKTCWVNA